MKSLSLILLLSLLACGGSDPTDIFDSVGDEFEDLVDDIQDDDEDEDLDSDNLDDDLGDLDEDFDEELDDIGDGIDDEFVDDVEPVDDGATTSSFITGRTFMPSSASGFRCQAADTRGGQTVCLLPYQYTLAPSYTKTDSEGNSFSCNVNGETFDRFILDAAGAEFPMFFERDNPFGEQVGISDYFCANYVGTPSGRIGRTHVRLTRPWSDFNGQSVAIKVCDGSLCDTLILR